MMDAVTQIVVWLNVLADALGRWVLAPIGLAPAWFSATAVAAVTGVLMLVAFKYTSRQQAIKRVRDDISANLLALKLFKDSASAALQAQGRLLLAAGRLFLLALVPTAVMIVPMTLFLGQLGLWYEMRPLPVGEEAVVTMQLNGPADAPFPEASLQSVDGVETTAGPVRVRTPAGARSGGTSRQPRQGYHRLVFQVGEQQVDKELAVGDGFMRVSTAAARLVLLRRLVAPIRAAVRPRFLGPVDRDRVSQARLVDRPWRFLADVLVLLGHGRGGLGRRPGGPPGMGGLLVGRVDGRGPRL